jgi:hypothetical protein
MPSPGIVCFRANVRTQDIPNTKQKFITTQQRSLVWKRIPGTYTFPRYVYREDFYLLGYNGV